jgi:hypothetical protein
MSSWANPARRRPPSRDAGDALDDGGLAVAKIVEDDDLVAERHQLDDGM